MLTPIRGEDYGSKAFKQVKFINNGKNTFTKIKNTFTMTTNILLARNNSNINYLENKTSEGTKASKGTNVFLIIGLIIFILLM